MSLFDDLLTITNNLAQQAEATGTVQMFQWGDDAVHHITNEAGDVVGSYRLKGLEITITPKKKPVRKRRATRGARQ